MKFGQFVCFIERYSDDIKRVKRYSVHCLPSIVTFFSIFVHVIQVLYEA